MSARYTVEVGVLRFRNPGNGDFNGGCCETSCSNPCDHYFTFCLRSEGFPESINICPIDSLTADDPTLSTTFMEFDLGDDFAGESNPIQLGSNDAYNVRFTVQIIHGPMHGTLRWKHMPATSPPA